MATPHTALLLLLLAAGWTAEGSPRDQGESKALTTLGVPPSTLSTISHGGTPLLGPERLTVSEEEEEEEEEDYSEEYELSGSEELHDGMSPAKVQAVVKPQNKDQRKKGSNLKGKGRKNKNGRKKKPNLCKTTFKDYCIHGKCKYLKDLDKPSCICLPGYQNERCGIQALQTGKNEKHFDSLSVTLMVVGVALFIFTLTAVTAAVTLHMRKKMRVEGETESEDKQKLRSENGIVV
ncbi:amphiregulin-like [Pristis pectinata]|uniref:amphiregulin-like n=1 Tax=Pristis pectinata TaxID=685728 RepID=UPI00223CE2ED|nr:amphiregulin-like [Pristis pectinata]